MKTKTEQLLSRAEELDHFLREQRREFHRYPEKGWMEIRTSEKIAGFLKELGYEVHTGRELTGTLTKMGLPEEEEFLQHKEWALANGVRQEALAYHEDGNTAVIAVMKGRKKSKENPKTLAFRFDLDALPITESIDEAHLPVQEGFRSADQGVMHACGHDGHMAIGLGTAILVKELQEEFSGEVRLIFQPAEEGVRGAKTLVDGHFLDGIEYLSGCHLQASENGECYVTPGMAGTLATTKLDVQFYGRSAHAGFYPEKGNNALLAAATAVLNLQAIPRHGSGSSRINVGRLEAGSGRNIICDHAALMLEVRGETTEINAYMESYARRILKSAAAMHDCTVEIKEAGSAAAMVISEDFCNEIADCAKNTFGLSVRAAADMGGSEDFATMAEEMVRNGKKVCFAGLHTPVKGAFHSPDFDFDEKILVLGVQYQMAVFWSVFCMQ